MKKLILILVLIVLSCSVESEVEIQELNSDLSGISIKGSKNDKISICHFDADNNEWKTLNVNQNAMAAHLNHGDAIDVDSDGFFDRENGCSPIDCDDDDSEVGECPAPIYLDENGITIKAKDWAEVGDVGVLNNIEYIVVDETLLREMVANNEDVSKVVTTRVTDMNFLFYKSEGDWQQTSDFNQDISSWDVSNVTKMYYMFFNNHEFDQNLSYWDVSNVDDMHFMFYGAKKFNSPLNTWNTSKLTRTSAMFLHCINFDQPLDNWDVSNVTNFSAMFQGSNFNQDISNWNMSNAVNIVDMFANTRFNYNINSWDVSKVEYMWGVFHATKEFNQPLDNWDVSNVVDMGAMFSFSKKFNQDISSWNTKNVVSMRQMFEYSTAFNQDLTLWCVPNITSKPTNFNVGSILTENNSPIWGTCPKDNLLLYLPLNGDVNDYSGNNVAMASNGVELTTDRFGYADSAYLIDNNVVSGSGAGDLIWSDDKFMQNTEENYSFSFWVNYSNSAQQHHTVSLIGTSGGIATTYNMNPSRNKIAHWRSTHLNSTGWDVLANSQFSGSVSPNTWLHITVTKSGEVYKYYLNGVLDRTINVDPSLSYETGTVRIKIGNNTYNYNNGSWGSFIEQMKGKVDDVFVWNRTLSDTEIAKHYDKR